MMSHQECRDIERAQAERLSPAAVPHTMPIVNDQPAIQDLVIADIEVRKRIGREKYGTLLQPFNGRPTLIDVYQELLDVVQYMRQALEENNQLAAALESLLKELEDEGPPLNVWIRDRAAKAREVLNAYRAGNPVIRGDR